MDKHSYSKIEKEQFRKYSDRIAPNSHIVRDSMIAFIVGGIICVIGELISSVLNMLDLNQEHIKTLVPSTLIVLANILTVFGIYKKIAKYAGAGTLVPITGFANAICSVSIDSTAEGYILGVGAKMFTIAGPVILYGTASSIIYGTIYYIIKLMF